MGQKTLSTFDRLYLHLVKVDPAAVDHGDSLSLHDLGILLRDYLVGCWREYDTLEFLRKWDRLQ